MYHPTKQSVKKHQVPEWFHDAKLGIFIHWGLYSVPAFAVTGLNLIEVIKQEGFGGQFKKNPYAEWYLNSLRIIDSPTHQYHKDQYGKDFAYEDFIPLFNEAIKNWNPTEMAETFKKAGAQYVVLVTKHHDGFLLWPSTHSHPKKEGYHTSRDIVGELTQAVKERDMKMGFYYSGALDWSFNPNPIMGIIDLLTSGITDQEYIDYANNHWYELIDNYEPLILWNDIGYPPGTNIYEIFAYFYNSHPKGVVNDRWSQISKVMRKIIKFKPFAAIIRWVAKRRFIKGISGVPSKMHYDFKTPEYTHFQQIKKDKWESTRGIGNSFGYNQFEKEEDYLTSEELIKMFVDIVSKNGNLLLNVGPKADGTIPELQEKCLLELGEWLEINGAAIFGTRPWDCAESITKEGIPIRYTQKEEFLYIFILDKPESKKITISCLEIPSNAQINLLGKDESLRWTQKGKNLEIILPDHLSDSPVYTLAIIPKSEK